jgi:hypothetical protein
MPINQEINRLDALDGNPNDKRITVLGEDKADQLTDTYIKQTDALLLELSIVHENDYFGFQIKDDLEQLLKSIDAKNLENKKKEFNAQISKWIIDINNYQAQRELFISEIESNEQMLNPKSREEVGILQFAPLAKLEFYVQEIRENTKKFNKFKLLTGEIPKIEEKTELFYFQAYLTNGEKPGIDQLCNKMGVLSSLCNKYAQVSFDQNLEEVIENLKYEALGHLINRNEKEFQQICQHFQEEIKRDEERLPLKEAHDNLEKKDGQIREAIEESRKRAEEFRETTVTMQAKGKELESTRLTIQYTYEKEPEYQELTQKAAALEGDLRGLKTIAISQQKRFLESQFKIADLSVEKFELEKIYVEKLIVFSLEKLEKEGKIHPLKGSKDLATISGTIKIPKEEEELANAIRQWQEIYSQEDPNSQIALLKKQREELKFLYDNLENEIALSDFLSDPSKPETPEIRAYREKKAARLKEKYDEAREDSNKKWEEINGNPQKRFEYTMKDGETKLLYLDIGITQGNITPKETGEIYAYFEKYAHRPFEIPQFFFEGMNLKQEEQMRGQYKKAFKSFLAKADQLIALNFGNNKHVRTVGTRLVGDLHNRMGMIYSIFSKNPEFFTHRNISEENLAEWKKIVQERKKMYEDENLSDELQQAHDYMLEYNQAFGQGHNVFSNSYKRMEQMIESYKGLESLYLGGENSKFVTLCNKIEELKPDTITGNMADWLKTNGVVITAAVVGAIAAAATGGAALAAYGIVLKGTAGLVFASACAGVGATFGTEIGKGLIGMEMDFSIGHLAQGFVTNTAMSLLCVGVGKYVGTALNRPGVGIVGQGFQKMAQGLNKVFDMTSGWGIIGKTGGEVVQELSEEGAENIHPLASFALSVLNSMDGMSVHANVNSTVRSIIDHSTITSIDQVSNTISYAYDGMTQAELVTKLKATGAEVVVRGDTVVTKFEQVLKDGGKKTITYKFIPTKADKGSRLFLEGATGALFVSKYRISFNEVKGKYEYTTDTTNTTESLIGNLQISGFVCKLNPDGSITAIKGSLTLEFIPREEIIIKEKVEEIEEDIAREYSEYREIRNIGSEIETLNRTKQELVRSGDPSARAKIKQIEASIKSLEERISGIMNGPFMKKYETYLQKRASEIRGTPSQRIIEYKAMYQLISQRYPAMLRQAKGEMEIAKLEISTQTESQVVEGTISPQEALNLANRLGFIEKEAMNLLTKAGKKREHISPELIQRTMKQIEAKYLANPTRLIEQLQTWQRGKADIIQKQKALLSSLMNPEIEEMIMMESIYGVQTREEVNLSDTLEHRETLLQGKEKLDDVSAQRLKQHAKQLLDRINISKKISPDNEILILKLTYDLIGTAKESGLTTEQATKLVEDSIEKLTYQTIESTGRQLGDHGIRHIYGNIKVATDLMAQYERSGKPFSIRQKLLMIITQINHDMGYTAALGANGFDGTQLHPLVSEIMLESRRALLVDIVGEEGFLQMQGFIRNHDGTEFLMDTDTHLMGSIIRISDNMALFSYEKLPEIFAKNPRALRILGILQIANESGIGKSMTIKLKEELKGMVDAEVLSGKISQSEAVYLKKAINEIFFKSGQFTLGMTGGKYGSELFTIEESNERLNINLEESVAKDLIERAFDGNFKPETEQFLKMINDYRKGAGLKRMSAKEFKAEIEAKGYIEFKTGGLTMRINVSSAQTLPATEVATVRSRLIEIDRKLLELQSKIRENPNMTLLNEYEQLLTEKSRLSEYISMKEIVDARTLLEKYQARRSKEMKSILEMDKRTFERLTQERRVGYARQIMSYMERLDIGRSDPRYEVLNKMIEDGFGVRISSGIIAVDTKSPPWRIFKKTLDELIQVETPLQERALTQAAA